MNILYVVHYFLPRHQAGTEIYTSLLARAFREQGHEVMVFTSEDGTPAPGRLALRKDEWEGIPVFRLLRGEPGEFERSYTNPETDALFREFLARHKPDVVHFQHTFRLSAGMIAECKKAGARAIVTLADYWFICPSLLLLAPGLALCPGPDLDRCARCGNAIGALYAGAPGSALAGSENPRLAAAGRLVSFTAERAVRAAHALKRRLPRGVVESLRAWKQARELADPGSAFQNRRGLIAKRRDTMKQALAAADLVIAPSGFLREKMIAAGVIAPDKIVHSDYGFDRGPFQKLERKNAPPLRFGFMGTPVEHKGAHLAVAAMNELRDTDAELLVYGDLSWFPAYARRLKRMAENPRIRFPGRFENRDAAKILAALDALIVPSLWYENSPLTIHEAFMAQTPVIASAIGGMAELLRHGGGLTFKTGDAQDLAALLRELVNDPRKLEALRSAIPEVKSIEENAAELVRFYMPPA